MIVEIILEDVRIFCHDITQDVAKLFMKGFRTRLEDLGNHPKAAVMLALVWHLLKVLIKFLPKLEPLSSDLRRGGHNACLLAVLVPCAY